MDSYDNHRLQELWVGGWTVDEVAAGEGIDPDRVREVWDQNESHSSHLDAAAEADGS
jgi:hypothetical protein